MGPPGPTFEFDAPGTNVRAGFETRSVVEHTVNAGNTEPLEGDTVVVHAANDTVVQASEATNAMSGVRPRATVTPVLPLINDPSQTERPKATTAETTLPRQTKSGASREKQPKKGNQVSAEGGLMSEARRFSGRRKYMKAAEIIGQAIKDSSIAADTDFVGRTLFNASLQAARSGLCEKAGSLARQATQFNDPASPVSNSVWNTTLASFDDCKSDTVRLVLREIGYK